jgi:hypothetical protein
MVYEVSRTKELDERRRAHSVDHAGIEKHRAWYVLATRGLVVSMLMRPSSASLPPKYSLSPPMPCSSHNTS